MGGFVDSLDVGENALTVRWWYGKETPVPFLWLRDNCDSGDRRIEQTEEKRFHIFAVDKDLRPDLATVHKVEADGETIRLVWPDGHHTRYGAGYLHALLAPPRQKLNYWDCQFRPQYFDFGDFLRDGVAAHRADLTRISCPGSSPKLAELDVAHTTTPLNRGL